MKHYIVLNLICNRWEVDEAEPLFLEAAIVDESFVPVYEGPHFSVAFEVPDMALMLDELEPRHREALHTSGLVRLCEEYGVPLPEGMEALADWMLAKSEQIPKPVQLIPCGFQLHRVLPVFADLMQSRYEEFATHELTSFLPYVQLHGSSYRPDVMGLDMALEYARRVHTRLCPN